jgi:hypothetical protein
MERTLMATIAEKVSFCLDTLKGEPYVILRDANGEEIFDYVLNGESILFFQDLVEKKDSYDGIEIVLTDDFQAAFEEALEPEVPEDDDEEGDNDLDQDKDSAI